MGGDTGLLLLPAASCRLEDRDTGEARLEPGAGPGPRARPEQRGYDGNEDMTGYDVTEVVSGGAGAQGRSYLIHGAEARDPGDGQLVTRHQAVVRRLVREAGERCLQTMTG